jgi:hypothetical protein
MLLQGTCSLQELISRVRRHASQTGEAYLRNTTFLEQLEFARYNHGDICISVCVIAVDLRTGSGQSHFGISEHLGQHRCIISCTHRSTDVYRNPPHPFGSVRRDDPYGR